MKRIISLFIISVLALSLAFSLASCTDNDEIDHNPIVGTDENDGEWDPDDDNSYGTEWELPGVPL